MRHQSLSMLLGGIMVLLAGAAPGAFAQEQANSGIIVSLDRRVMNENTVKIISGKLSGTHLPIVEDMATVLDNGDKLRVLAIIGKGSAQNVADVLFLKGIDMGITHANVMAYFKGLDGIEPNLERRLVYITTLFNEEVHVVARSGTDDLSQLDGKTVNLGEPGTGTNLTAQLIFDTLNIKVNPVFLAQADALEKVRSGEIAATILLAGKPAGALEKLRGSSDFALLPIPFEEALEEDYLPSTLTNEDYPDLIAEGEAVDTVAVAAVLASYNWSRGGDRHRRLAKFVDAFFGKFKEFRKKPRHPKWKEVNLFASLRGWNRLPYAQKWLDDNKPAEVARTAPQGQGGGARTFRDFIGGGGQASAPAGLQGQDRALFEQFLAWKRAQAGGGAQQGQGAGQQTGGAQLPSSASRPSLPSGRTPDGPRLW